MLLSIREYKYFNLSVTTFAITSIIYMIFPSNIGIFFSYSFQVNYKQNHSQFLNSPFRRGNIILLSLTTTPCLFYSFLEILNWFFSWLIMNLVFVTDWLTNLESRKDRLKTLFMPKPSSRNIIMFTQFSLQDLTIVLKQFVSMISLTTNQTVIKKETEK